jgi:hypothetical protein
MPDVERGLFTIRVYVDPLRERLERDPALACRLANLLENCSPAVLAYKGMDQIAAPALAWLRGRAEAP